MSSIRIVRADLTNDEQLRSICGLTNMYALEATGLPLAPEVLDRLPDAIRSQPAYYALIAYDGDEAIGIATCLLSFSSFAAKPILNLHDLAVNPSHRNRGIGSALLLAVEELARDLGCSKVSLEVSPSNPARSLYKRSGFDEVSIYCTKRME